MRTHKQIEDALDVVMGGWRAKRMKKADYWRPFEQQLTGLLWELEQLECDIDCMAKLFKKLTNEEDL